MFSDHVVLVPFNCTCDRSGGVRGRATTECSVVYTIACDNDDDDDVMSWWSLDERTVDTLFVGCECEV